MEQGKLVSTVVNVVLPHYDDLTIFHAAVVELKYFMIQNCKHHQVNHQDYVAKKKNKVDLWTLHIT